MRSHLPRLRTLAAALALLVVLAPVLPVRGQQAPRELVFENVERVISVADIHGDHADLVAMLRHAGILDGDLRWVGGRTHLVFTGDFLDRGAESRRVIELFMRLEEEARQAGGRVHVVLGNHEVMNVLGDLRDVSPFEYLSYVPEEPQDVRAKRLEEFRARPGNRRRPPADVDREFQERFPPGYFGHRAMLGPEGPFGRWLLEKPVLIVVNRTAYLHGGLAPRYAGRGVQAIDDEFRRWIKDYAESWQVLAERDVIPFDMLYADRPAHVADALAGSRGLPSSARADAERFVAAANARMESEQAPFWYRGNALCHPWSEGRTVRAALAALAADRIVVGHTFAAGARIVSRFDGRFIKADTGLNRAVYQGRSSALLVENGRAAARYLDDGGKPVPIEPEPFYAGSVALRLGDPQLLDVLQNGAPQTVEWGKDGSARVLFRRERIPVAARFWPETTPERLHEVAAFRVDRALGVGFVPVTVRRSIEGREGVLQFIPQNAVSQRQAREQRLRSAGFCTNESQISITRLFDAIIGHAERSTDTVLLDIYDWRMTLVGHGAAFDASQRFQSGRIAGWLRESDEARGALAEVDEAALRSALTDTLAAPELEALLERLRAARAALPPP